VEAVEGGGLGAACRRRGLGAEAVLARARAVVRHRRRHVRDVAGLLQWTLDRELSLGVLRREIDTLSANLGTTYEELSLVYRLSAQMEVTHSAGRFFGNVCRELREVMDISAAAAVIRPAPADRDADEQVVVDGRLDLNAQQVRLLAASRVVPRLAEQRALVDNAFCADAGSGVGRAVRGLIAAGMGPPGAPLGVLIGFNKVAGDFDSVDLKLIQSIAHQGATFLVNRRLYAELRDLLTGALDALTTSIDAKDPYTRGHSQRVALIARRLAAELGFGPERLRRVYLAGLLHDIGKIGIPERVLCKPGGLTDPEYENIKRHPAVGARILEGIRHLEAMIPAILTHHERPDGQGYPQGLRGEQIPVEGKILCLADVFDAMTSERTYRKALPLATVVEEFRRHAGTQFDAGLVEVLLSMDLEGLLAEARQEAGRGLALPVMPRT
jgi:putative nucleotidyltransferase with HDIG domain